MRDVIEPDGAEVRRLGHAPAPVAKHLDAAGPMRKKSKRLLVADIKTFRAHLVLEIVLGRHFVPVVLPGIEPVEAEEFGRGHKYGVPEEILIIAPEHSGGNLTHTLEIILEPHFQ